MRLNKKKYYLLYPLIFIVFNTGLLAQTTQWRLIWDKNSEQDTVTYYVVYGNTNAIPSSSDSIGSRNHPADVNQDSVVYLDNNLLRGTRYYYSVIAVDYLKRRSRFSEVVSAAIPQISFNSLDIPASSTIDIDLDATQYVLDPDDNFSDLSWSVSGGSQITVVINQNTHVATITTPADTTVQENFTFSVYDDDGFYDTKSIPISVSSANQAPFIVSNAVLIATEGELYEYQVVATDPNVGDVLTYSLQVAPNWLDINTSSGLISGIPSANDVGVETVIVEVNDNRGASDTQTYTLTVQSKSSASIIASLNVTYYGSNVVGIEWETFTATKDYIKYGLSTNYDLETKIDPEFTTEHEYIFRDLTPNTTYYYQIVSEDITGRISTSSNYTLVTGDTGEVNVFPIPYVAGTYTENDGITFTNLPPASTISIYNLLGEPVFSEHNVTHVYIWTAINESRKKVQAGLYLYFIKDQNNKEIASGKLVIIR